MPQPFSCGLPGAQHVPTALIVLGRPQNRLMVGPTGQCWWIAVSVDCKLWGGGHSSMVWWKKVPAPLVEGGYGRDPAELLLVRRGDAGLDGPVGCSRIRPLLNRGRRAHILHAGWFSPPHCQLKGSQVGSCKEWALESGCQLKQMATGQDGPHGLIQWKEALYTVTSAMSFWGLNGQHLKVKPFTEI